MAMPNLFERTDYKSRPLSWKPMYTFRDFMVVCLVALTYFITAWIGLSISSVGGFAALIWAPAGIAVAAAIFSRRYLPGVFVAACAVNVFAGAPLVIAFLIALGNTAAAFIAAYLLYRVVHFDRKFEGLTDVFGFLIFGAMLPTMVSATVGVGALVMSATVPAESFASTWLAWWVGDMSGVVIVAPFLLTWIARDDLYPGRERRIWSVSEFIAFVSVFAFTMAFVFIDSLHPMLRRGPLASLMFLPHIWAAIRFGRRYTITATVISAMIAIYATVMGNGPFASAVQPLVQQLYFLQFFDIVMATIVLVVAVVMSQRVHAEDRIFGLNTALVEAQSLSNTGSWEYGLESKTLKWSNEFYHIHGREPSDMPIIKSAFAAQAHPEDKAQVIEAIDAVLERLEAIDIFYRIILKDNTVRYLHTIAKPVVGRWGSIDKVIGVTKDITEHKIAELRVEEKTAELETAVDTIQKSDTAKTDFIAVLAHELRNPLAPIVSTIELLKYGEPEKVREYVAQIEHQITTMRVLLDDLLDLSRISHKKISLDKRAVDLRTVVQSALDTVTPYVKSRGHTVTISQPDTPLFASVDPVRVEQIVVNLLNNAAKYTNEGGFISLVSKKENGIAEISVTDNGIGIQREHMKSIFEAFSQVEQPETRHKSGIGVGLHLVQELVTMHDGTISVDSPGQDKGSTFTVRLRMLPDDVTFELQDTPTVPKGERLVSQGLPVLLVDDNVSALNALSRLLGRMGYEVRTAESGKGALEMLETFDPAVMLLDIGMPEFDGFELARAIRLQKKFKRTTLVALTGYGQEEDRKRSREAGFDHHLVKPVSAAVIKDTIEDALKNN